jgi:hypothetical protein
MRVRFLADNDLRKAIVRGSVRQEPQVDFRSAQAARLDGLPDFEVLELAAREGRVLVSHDFETMPRHFRSFTARHRSPGVLLIAQNMPVGQAVESLLLIWEASEREDWMDRMCLVPSLATILLNRPE